MNNDLDISVSNGIAASDQLPVVQGETFDKPFAVKTWPEIFTRQRGYLLSLANFQILKGYDTRNGLFKIAGWIFGPTVGYGLSLSGKLIWRAAIKPWEWNALICGFVISAVLYIIGRRQPDPKKGLFMDIEKHFKEHKEEIWMDLK